MAQDDGENFHELVEEHTALMDRICKQRDREISRLRREVGRLRAELRTQPSACVPASAPGFHDERTMPDSESTGRQTSASTGDRGRVPHGLMSVAMHGEPLSPKAFQRRGSSSIMNSVIRQSQTSDNKRALNHDTNMHALESELVASHSIKEKNTSPLYSASLSRSHTVQAVQRARLVASNEEDQVDGCSICAAQDAPEGSVSDLPRLLGSWPLPQLNKEHMQTPQIASRSVSTTCPAALDQQLLSTDIMETASSGAESEYGADSDTRSSWKASVSNDVQLPLAQRMRTLDSLPVMTSLGNSFRLRSKLGSAVNISRSSHFSWDKVLSTPLSFGSTRSGSFVSPAHFELWPMWEEILLLEAFDSPLFKADSVEVDRPTTGFSEQSPVNHTGSWRLCRILQKLDPLVLHPGSPKRMGWMSLGLVIIAYDIVITPLSFFGINQHAPIRVLHWITVGFWILDFPACFVTGYHLPRGDVEMRAKATMKKYALSWMCFDALILAVDWLILASDGSGGVTMVAQRLRALRSLRLLRALKMPKAMRDAAVFVGLSESTSLTLGIIKHLLVILVLNHVIACIWYLVGVVESSSKTWVRAYCDGMAVPEMYFTALHWSLTQFTPAAMDVQPQNLTERAFAVSVLLFALITFSSVVSSITNMMNHLRTMHAVEQSQFSKLQRYLQEHRISFSLTCRVCLYLEHLFGEQQKYLQEKDVELINRLSEALQIELRYEVHASVLLKHPFFYFCNSANLTALQRTCHEALSVIFLCQGDVVFSPGDAASAMFFVLSGDLTYERTVSSPRRDRGTTASWRSCRQFALEIGEWCCEAVLWTAWEHLGELRATIRSRVLRLDAQTFHTILGQNRIMAQQPAVYASEAVKCLNSCPISELSDLQNDMFDCAVIAKRAFVQEDRDKSSSLSELFTANLSGRMPSK